MIELYCVADILRYNIVVS